jgi:hypothetical protein
MNLELPKPKKQAGGPDEIGLQIDASKLDKSEPDEVELDKSKPEKKARVKRQKEGLLRKGQKVRIYPTKDQETLLAQWIGSGRYLWNMALAKQNEHYELHKKHLSTAELSKETTALRKEPGMEWLGEVPRTALAQTLGILDKPWGAFFDGVSGKRQDSPGKPKFRSRGGSRESATFQADHRQAAIFRLMESTKNLFTIISKLGTMVRPPPGDPPCARKPTRAILAARNLRKSGSFWRAPARKQSP